jgi:peptidoglycan/xylan/chitin deacetylase (PgdA/CDA1 family)
LTLATAGCATWFPPADARESDLGAAELLDKLHYYRVPAAFCLSGEFVEQHPDLTRRIAAEGHEIYNHSYSTPLLRHAPEARIVEQLRRADAAIVRATGRTSKPFFRPAYGEVDENLRRVAFREDYRVVRWSVTTDDWGNEFTAQKSTNTLGLGTSTTDRDQNFSLVERQR